ncbi:early nodulin-like protein 3 [Momordica charantia]|uniref:Early nodulin-like protein 3 n=1 Tax=Momordica charantia TaxID=3673 RepID=A0A6J1DBQ0_MOMCH|nr:early nodulin-like protein 3 [Momordica charantia]
MGKKSSFGVYCSQNKGCVFGVMLVLLLQKACGVEFQVGGSKGFWGVSSDSNAQSFNQWAETRRFQAGDSLVFNYQAGQDSVLLVKQDDYKNCNTEAPIKHFSDGHTIFKFEKSGPYYFISGNKDNCLKNQKLVVVVLADRTKQYSSPPPTPIEEEPTSPPPSSEASSQPPEALAHMNPTPSPLVIFHLQGFKRLLISWSLSYTSMG